MKRTSFLKYIGLAIFSPSLLSTKEKKQPTTHQSSYKWKSEYKYGVLFFDSLGNNIGGIQEKR